uniref:NADH-ubiquinone oxidoreductase chain 4 n=1 Tax=Fascioloides magna TaxID=394415 RepID=A0A109WVL6_9TREM|nr:NADH dehydrogenase subunit 4 [Fascioloides magna]AMF83644.1 NADH dehydrogenase subunit 4 [Fascioloides magna]
MGFQKFDWYSWCLGVAGFILIKGVLLLLSGLGFWLLGLYSIECGVFVFDSVSFYLCLLSLFLGASMLFVVKDLSVSSRIMLSTSLIFSLLCYCCVSGLWFWVFYEMSILPLLFLLILESPYSERFIASWYLLGYVVFSSLPMLLCIFYLGGLMGSYRFQDWNLGVLGYSSFGVYIILAVMFITKIPLPPFHIWLPIVHAEASSPVSMCLSGYIMKLGLLGVLRFCYSLLSDFVFSYWYVGLALGFTVLFFFSASRELDGKRWLAFLSLAHIVIVSVCFSVCWFDEVSLSLVYSLGHGVSAGVTFMLLWFLYEVSGSRNWLVLKGAISGSLLVRCVTVMCLCSTASIPPTVNFFSEVAILSECGFSLIFGVLLLCIYLFVGGLVPVFLVGCLLARHCSVSFNCGYVVSYLGGVTFLVVWCYLLFLVL